MNKINNSTKIEMLCELAHNRVKEDFRDITKYGTNKYIEEDLSYTEKAQNVFDEYYDYYDSIILSYLKEKDE
jgi:hypothetical protein